ncbi:MAG: hypothetical protein P8X74_08840 [Reinekea sp.]
MGEPATFEKQIEIKLLHSASTLESRIQVLINRMFSSKILVYVSYQKVLALKTVFLSSYCSSHR